MAEISLSLSLPERLRRRLAADRAQRRLERTFGALMRTLSRAEAGAMSVPSGSRIGLATFGSGTWHLALELLLARALALRGAAPELLVCDLPDLPVCDERTSLLRDPSRCRGCLPAKRPLLEIGRIPWRGLSAFLERDSLGRAQATIDEVPDEALDDYRHDGQHDLARWTYVSACHFLRGEARGRDPETMAVRRRFLVTAVVVVEAVGRWLDEVRPAVVIAESGAHFMWRIAFELARARGIRVVCREIGKGGWDRHIYSLNAECMFPNWRDLWARIKDVPLSPAQIASVDAYLPSLPEQTCGSSAIDEVSDHGHTRWEQIQVPAGRPLAVLFTNVTWDLAAAGRDAGFAGMLDWVMATLTLAERTPQATFVIRVHPAEGRVLTRERVLDQVSERWPRLPDNVRCIPPESPISARHLCEIADLVLVYCSTAGLEAAIYGKPVVVCGAPHYRDRGFTIDVGSRAEYAETIERWASGALRPPSPEASDVARRYFHLFFHRYHLTMGWTTSPLEPPFQLTIADLSALLPGRNAALDAVCRGILEGREILLEP